MITISGTVAALILFVGLICGVFGLLALQRLRAGAQVPQPEEVPQPVLAPATAAPASMPDVFIKHRALDPMRQSLREQRQETGKAARRVPASPASPALATSRVRSDRQNVANTPKSESPRPVHRLQPQAPSRYDDSADQVRRDDTGFGLFGTSMFSPSLMDTADNHSRHNDFSSSSHDFSSSSDTCSSSDSSSSSDSGSCSSD